MKRGESGLSLVAAVNKPSGMSSHDVVNRCRRIFGERRVGHTGTLDPLASGVLPICIGPATRLDKYLTAHNKSYRVTIAFGFETATDDALGDPTVFGDVGEDMLDGAFAEAYVSGLVGERLQVPPQYSAIKKAGKKAYELARNGALVELEPRPIEVYESMLVDRHEDRGRVYWVIDLSVSKGTYIRALARDIGRELGCRAHVAALERRRAGSLGIDDCVSLESLEVLGAEAAIDPVRLLGYRFLFGDREQKAICSGARLDASRFGVHEFSPYSAELGQCACTGTVIESDGALEDGELLSMVVANRLKAVYRYDATCNLLKSDCVFATPVSRG